MTTQQGARQAAARAIASTTADYNGDMLAMFAAEATIAEGQTFNGALMTWLQDRLSSSNDSLPGLMQEFAEAENAHNWSSLGTFAAGAGLVLIDREAGTNIGNLTAGGGLAAAFDGNTNQAATACASLGATTSAWVGKTLAAAKVFGRAVAHGSNDVGFWGLGAAITVTLTVYGKTGAAPASATDGTLLGSLEYSPDAADESAGRTIESTDLENEWDHLWLRVQKSGANDACRVAELVLYEWA